MDDISQALGGERPKTPVEEAWHAEQERKKYDIIRVKNPTNQDFYVKYDTGRYQKIPANSTVDVPRYIATRYITHQKDAIIHAMSQTKHDEYMKEREAKGLPRYKSKWEENEETYSSSEYPKTNDDKLMEQVISDLWVGLVYEFGRDVPPQSMDPRAGEVNLTPQDVRIMEKFEKRKVDPNEQPSHTFAATPIPAPSVTPPPPAPESNFSKLSEALSPAEITNETS